MKLLISGAKGRMGQELLKLAPEAIPHDKGDNLDEGIKQCDVIIDFSTPEFSLDLLELASQHKKGVVIGTTGFKDSELERLHSFAKDIPILHSHNMSIGINILLKIVLELGSTLSAQDFDAEILEMHHKHKKDAPSGTAISLGEAVAEGRGASAGSFNFVREGREALRKEGEIGFATLRGGSVIGEHSVIFASEQERIEISHKAENRGVFASGAIFASKFIYKKLQSGEAGLFNMNDVIK